MTHFLFRKATLSDLPQLEQLAYELNLFHGDNTRPSAERLKQDWNKFEVYIVLDGNKIVGFIAGYQTYQFHSATLSFEIQNVFVTETHRRHGIGRLIFEQTIRLKYAEGIHSFKLGVWETNHQARAFYENFGFELKTQPNLRYALAGERLENLIRCS
jgi:ribosomal protein S18 acetylase RimI-like enzyme